MTEKQTSRNHVLEALAAELDALADKAMGRALEHEKWGGYMESARSRGASNAYRRAASMCLERGGRS